MTEVGATVQKGLRFYRRACGSTDPEFPQVLSCGMLGRVVAGLGVLSRLGYAGLYVGSIGFDGLPKAGLSLHWCDVVIPVRLPLWGLSQMGWRWPGCLQASRWASQPASGSTPFWMRYRPGVGEVP